MFIVPLTEVFSLIRVRGANRVDFLHRMSTGNLLKIQPGTGRTTVFTTPIGRMVDHAVVLAFPDTLLLISGGYGHSSLMRWLRKYIFFNDDVQMTDETHQNTHYGVFGDGASEFIESYAAGAARLSLHCHQSIDNTLIVAAAPLAGPAYFLINPPSSLMMSQQVDDRARYDDHRIAAGYPAFPNEINTDYIPLEAGLIDAISFTKGCYIGQEIIARMESRGQLARRLVRLDVEGATMAGSELRVDATAAGKVTSVSSDGRHALGYVRSAFVAHGQRLVSGDDAVLYIHNPD